MGLEGRGLVVQTVTSVACDTHARTQRLRVTSHVCACGENTALRTQVDGAVGGAYRPGTGGVL